ncbi:MAG: ester cyclase [Anaerolineales bacterium]|nr:ester cyclase [Anaerolineales bacterium]MCB9145350.1 ester cyclase [Anaerolineales bacterium]
MNKRETVQAFMDSVQQGEFNLAKSMLADDFRFSGSVPEPIDKEAWLEMSINLKAAFPDLNYHFKMIGTDGDVVRSTTQLSGTHTGALNLMNINMGITPATNKSVSAKLAKTRITIKNDKITLWAVEPTDGAGLTAILGQLKVESGLS